MERPGTYALAAAGALGGAWKYYVRPEITAPRAWAVMAAGIVAYELAAPPGELLSEGVDRALEKSPLAKAATLVLIGATALHLANALPDAIDPFKRGLDLLRT
jgi:hypothetical protein